MLLLIYSKLNPKLVICIPKIVFREGTETISISRWRDKSMLLNLRQRHILKLKPEGKINFRFLNTWWI